MQLFIPPIFQKKKWNDKEQKQGKKGNQVCGLISPAKGNVVTLSLRHSLTEACSPEYEFVCLRVCAHTCANHTCMQYICVHLHLCLHISLCLACLSFESVGFWAQNERHRLQISLRLPAPVQEIDTFPAAFVEPQYLLTQNQLFSNTL